MLCRIAIVHSVLNDKNPLVLSTADYLDKDHHVSKAFESETGTTFGTYMPIKKFTRVVGGEVSNQDVLLDHAACFSESMNSKRALLQQRASREGYAPMDSVAVFTGGRKLKDKSTV